MQAQICLDLIPAVKVRLMTLQILHDDLVNNCGQKRRGILQ